MSKIIPVVALLASLSLPVGAAAAREAVLYKSPQCGCCEEYAKYLRGDGIAVRTVPTHDLKRVRRDNSVPAAIEGCHTMLLDGYVIEGHVPVDSINKLLATRPGMRGISLPGMPQGSPGMTGMKAGPFTIYSFGAGPPDVFAVE